MEPLIRKIRKRNEHSGMKKDHRIHLIEELVITNKKEPRLDEE